MARRAALVIGVNNAGNLVKLESAVSGGVEMANWLKREGFEVATCFDEEKEVTRQQIEDAIDAFVSRQHATRCSLSTFQDTATGTPGRICGS